LRLNPAPRAVIAVGFQNWVHGVDQRRSAILTIAAVSLRLVYLIFNPVLSLVVLMGRTTSSKDIELLLLRHGATVLRRTNPTPRLDWARSSGLRRPRPAPAHEAACPSPGHPGHHPALASPPRAPQVGLPEPTRTPTHRLHRRCAGGADGKRASCTAVGSHRRLAAHRLQLASVPANPGQHDVGRWVGHGAERYPERRLGGEEPDRAACLRA
jgi:hypothetical protein